MVEMFDVVDEDDNVIGQAPRAECHKNNKLIHRSAGVLVFNSKGELLLQKRSMTKDTNPGKWDISSWGHNDVGESYDHAAARELKEELGIDKAIKFALKSFYSVDYESEIYQVYIAESDGPFKPDPEEIIKLEFFSLDKIKKWIKESPEEFTEGCIQVLEEYFNLISGG